MFKYTYRILKGTAVALTITAFSVASPVHAADILTVKTIGTDLARDVATGTVKACEDKGYSVTAAVVDRSGQIIAVLRSQFAAIQTLDIAAGKARGAIMAGTSTTELRASRPDLAANLMHLDDIMMMDGGLPINAAGVRIGAVGVSGAPGGDIDEACALEALDDLADRIAFAE